VLQDPFKFVLLSKRDWSEAFQQYSVFSPTDGTRATFTIYLQGKKRVAKPVARMLTFGEDTDDIPAVFSASSPIDSGKKVIRRKRAPKAAAPLVDTSVRRSTRSSAKKDGHRHVALFDKSAPVSKKQKIQRRLKQKDCTEAIPKSPEGKSSSRTGSPGKENNESSHCTLPPTPIHVQQQIGLSLGIDPKDLTKEKLMTAPEKDSDSQSSADV
jgi:predicted RND superfamily exporter protein